MNWQPIDTCPDYTVVYLGFFDGVSADKIKTYPECYITLGKYNILPGDHVTSSIIGIDNHLVDLHIRKKPTHYALIEPPEFLLPEPPKEETKP